MTTAISISDNPQLLLKLLVNALYSGEDIFKEAHAVISFRQKIKLILFLVVKLIKYRIVLPLVHLILRRLGVRVKSVTPEMEDLQESLASLTRCSTVSQLAYLLLRCLGVRVRGVVAPEHALAVVSVNAHQALLVDFSLGRIEEIELKLDENGNFISSSHYEKSKEGEYLVLMNSYSGIRITNGYVLTYSRIRITNGYALKPVLHYNLTFLLEQLGRCDEAEEHYKEALRCDPDYTLAHFNLANLFFKSGRPEEAEEAYREALRCDPDDAFAHFNLAVLLFELHKINEAIQEWAEAVLLDEKLLQRISFQYRKSVMEAASTINIQQQGANSGGDVVSSPAKKQRGRQRTAKMV